jgi:hypothetical protein
MKTLIDDLINHKVQVILNLSTISFSSYGKLLKDKNDKGVVTYFINDTDHGVFFKLQDVRSVEYSIDCYPSIKLRSR